MKYTIYKGNYSVCFEESHTRFLEDTQTILRSREFPPIKQLARDWWY